MLGLRLDDVIGMEGLTVQDVMPFSFPSDIEAADVQGIWLGDYVDWDGWKNGFIAQQYGFEVSPHPVETRFASTHYSRLYLAPLFGSDPWEEKVDGKYGVAESWTYLPGARGIEIADPKAREVVYGMPYSEWKSKYQKEASAEQQKAFAQSHKHG